MKTEQVVIKVDKEIEFKDEKEILRYCFFSLEKRYDEIEALDKWIKDFTKEKKGGVTKRHEKTKRKLECERWKTNETI